MSVNVLDLPRLKAYLEVEHDGDDDLIVRMMNDAEAAFQSYVDRRIASAQHVEYHDGGVSRIFLQHWPVDDTQTFTVVDTQGTNTDATDDETVAANLYRLDPEKGTVMRTSRTGERSTWPRGRRRWKVTYTGGMAVGANWSAYQKGDVRRSLRDLVAHWYEDREDYDQDEIPERVRQTWDRYVPAY